ncbi:MAG: hypothetical protein M3405_06510 [Acidobacteriota bacterium]|jgi:hypothetical protein|nr:hypothetical protein [Acidobacteriota bacterium]
MQDVQNIPVPNENSNDVDEELGSHSGLQPESPADSEVNPNSDDDTGKAVSLPVDRDPFPKNEGVPDDEGDAERTDIEQI